MVQRWITVYYRGEQRVCYARCPSYNTCILNNVQENGHLFDVYLLSSLKAETRLKRGHGVRCKVTKEGRCLPNWWHLFRETYDKAELFNFLACIISSDTSPNVAIVFKNMVLSLTGLAIGSHEEADTRICMQKNNVQSQQHRCCRHCSQYVVCASGTSSAGAVGCFCPKTEHEIDSIKWLVLPSCRNVQRQALHLWIYWLRCRFRIPWKRR